MHIVCNTLVSIFGNKVLLLIIRKPEIINMYPEVDVIVVREMMLAESYGAHLWGVVAEVHCKPIRVLYTKAQVKLTESEMKHITGVTVLIVGGFWVSALRRLHDRARARRKRTGTLNEYSTCGSRSAFSWPFRV